MPHIPPFAKADLGAEVIQFSPTSSSSGVKITNVRPVASYSWIEAPIPTIAVPGSPNIWTDERIRRVPADSGFYIINQNSYRMGPNASPLAPLFAAVDELGEYDYASLDVVTDRNNLRQLLRWIAGTVDPEGFRIDIESSGKTCILTRRLEKNSEVIREFRGFGHEYEKAATTPAPGCENATGHHRIISMNIADLKVLQRFEVDACAVTSVREDWPQSISGIQIYRTTSPRLVPQSSLIELMTRASHKLLNWSEVYPQLYLSQTPHLYLAKHRKGVFMDVEKIPIDGEEMEPYMREVEQRIGKLRDVLVHILKAVREDIGTLFSLVCENGRLALCRREKESGMSVGKDILQKFSVKQDEE
ncbi:hypothetical protein BD410DRAFT_729467 [Rickenella mellea]|uniref:Geranylgeranyl pyrophosphate synthetase n=1 Tax=Rickenella mellea TaxID=50990 RepID=A0A4Y7PTB6_9AGAM|nr:hypothetical protein BD410DRAFT_729467 [Rickenella mellea]